MGSFSFKPVTAFAKLGPSYMIYLAIQKLSSKCSYHAFPFKQENKQTF